MSINYHTGYNRAIRAWLLKVFEAAAALSKEKLYRRACPVCGSSDSAFFANNDYLDYERCKECTLVFLNPAPSPETINSGFKGDDKLLLEYFDIITKYKTLQVAKPDPLTDTKLADIYKIKSSGRLLDVGCSVGEFLHRAKYFYDVEGVEINPCTAGVAAQYFKVHTKSLSELHLASSYDIVTLNQILYGLPDPAGLLKDIFHVLKDDGILYINTPNADSHAMQLYKGKANHLYGYTTQNVFNERSLATLASLTGFQIVSFRTEWLDIYVTDLIEYLGRPQEFIHKKNSHVQRYEEKLKAEDELHRRLKVNLGKGGNYLVAVLKKQTLTKDSSH